MAGPPCRRPAPRLHGTISQWYWWAYDCVMVIGVADAARRMGVRPERVLKLIHDERVIAQKVGNHWVIDESELSSKVWLKAPGRPLSPKNGMALAQVLEDKEPANLSAVEKHRLLKRVRHLRAHEDPKSQLMSWLPARAKRCDFSISHSDLSDFRDDPRIKLSGVSDPRSGLLPGNEIEAYVSLPDLDQLAADWYLVPASDHRHANVILRAVDGLPADVPAIFSAVDLAERPGPREQSASSSILRSVIDGH